MATSRAGTTAPSDSAKNGKVDGMATKSSKKKRPHGHMLQFILFAALVTISALPVILLEA
ncbi:MAG: hypothetical protein ACPGPC_14215 [Alphaproteobacteria bacterium]